MHPAAGTLRPIQVVLHPLRRRSPGFIPPEKCRAGYTLRAAIEVIAGSVRRHLRRLRRAAR